MAPFGMKPTTPTRGHGDKEPETRQTRHSGLHLPSRISPSGSGSVNGQHARLDVQSSGSRGPISPPPLKRTSTGSVPRTVSPAMNTTGRNPLSMNNLLNASSPNRGTDSVDKRSKMQSSSKGATKDTMGRGNSAGWTVSEIASELSDMRKDIRIGHARLASYAIESARPPTRKQYRGRDLFAGLNSQAEPRSSENSMRMKFKHFKSKKDPREGYHQVVCIKTNVERVPRYRFHHVEITKSVLTPNSMLTFVPHLRDLETSEEPAYNLWLKELEEHDLKSGFKPMNREEKSVKTAQSEFTRTVALYLESWLEKLAIPGCTKANLIKYMATKEPDELLTAQQRADIISSQNEANDSVPGPDSMAEKFTKAFHTVFTERSLPGDEQPMIRLRDVLTLDPSLDSIIEAKTTAKEGKSSPADITNVYDLADWALDTYFTLGCLVCFSHSCDHGEYMADNDKKVFSVSNTLTNSGHHLEDLLLRRRARSLHHQDQHMINGNGIAEQPCARRCYRSHRSSAERQSQSRPLSSAEVHALLSLFVTAEGGKMTKDPICLVADLLNRDCCEVHAEFEQQNISLPDPMPIDKPKARNLSWYDRHKKILVGDWQDHTVSHNFAERDIIPPCFHDGPCAPKICSCVDAGLLCEKFCHCTVEECAWKFNGCGCHSRGRSCEKRHNDKSSCICILLNRECDPGLCIPCGALERADPQNSKDETLHSTGCQNVAMQRGESRALLLGQSQLGGVMYGLFTAEDIAQDSFVIEYMGEIISHDEGVRREARRGEAFDEKRSISYLFTLLEKEGIWVDAAMYGNLSRYINHASEDDKRSCNIAPRILYVNGEFRIRFTATRDIKAGEELFFNYGNEFPLNLAQKLLDEKAGGMTEASRRRGKNAMTRRQNASRKTGMKKPGRPPGSKTTRHLNKAHLDTSDEDSAKNASFPWPTNARKRKRRVNDESDEDEYVPRGHATTNDQDSPSEVEFISPNGTRSLRRRARPPLGKGDFATQAMLGLPSKPKGKRGGARPGSGRPRKHPRPNPKDESPSKKAKPATRDESPSKKARTTSTTQDESPSKKARTTTHNESPLRRSRHTSNMEETSQADNYARAVLRPMGEDKTPEQRPRETTKTSTPRASEQAARSRRAQPSPEEPARQPEPQVEEIEDSDDEAALGDDDDTEDQDVMVRKRTPRSRRKPGRFRDQEVELT